jgi:hypothetical protein
VPYYVHAIENESAALMVKTSLVISSFGHFNPPKILNILNRKLGGPRNRSGRFGEHLNTDILPLLCGIKLLLLLLLILKSCRLK